MPTKQRHKTAPPPVPGEPATGAVARAYGVAQECLKAIADGHYLSSVYRNGDESRGRQAALSKLAGLQVTLDFLARPLYDAATGKEIYSLAGSRENSALAAVNAGSARLVEWGMICLCSSFPDGVLYGPDLWEKPASKQAWRALYGIAWPGADELDALRLALNAECKRVTQEVATTQRTPARTVSSRNKRKRQPSVPKPLTGKQAEAVHIVSECRGNIVEAARRLGKDRATVEQHYNAAMRKLGKKVIKAVTRPLPQDRRGQVSVSGDRRHV